MNEIQFQVLKGRHLLAQGNPGFTGSRPGLEDGFNNRPRNTVYQREFLCSDEMAQFFFIVLILIYSVRGMVNALFNCYLRTVFLLHLFPRAAFQIVPPETLPWAVIFWPFRPETHCPINLTKV